MAAPMATTSSGLTPLCGVLAEELLHHFLNLGHAGHAADQNHFVDVAGLQAGILESGLARLDGALDQILDQAFELGAGQLHRQVLGTRRIGGDEGQVDLGLRGEDSSILAFSAASLRRCKASLSLPQVDALVLLELVGQIADQTHVEVFAAQEGVAVGGLHLEHAVADLEDRDVERAAAKVVDGDGLAFGLVEAVGERSGGRLVDDAQHFKAGDLAGVLGGLALGVVEVGRNGDDGLLDLLTEIGLGGFLHLLKDDGGNLGRRE
jgi:hypothetical protein